MLFEQLVKSLNSIDSSLVITTLTITGIEKVKIRHTFSYTGMI